MRKFMCALAVSILLWPAVFEAHAEDDPSNPVPTLEEAVPVPSMDYFIEEYDRLLEQDKEGQTTVQFFIGKKYRYCQVIPEAYRFVRCKDCVSRGIGG